MDFAAPQLLPGADMVGDLRHQKRLADLSALTRKVCSRMEQIFNDGRAAFVEGLKQLGHGERADSAGQPCAAFCGTFPPNHPFPCCVLPPKRVYCCQNLF